jgi:Cu(I)/Ag(I) efflux system membrane fusion protein
MNSHRSTQRGFRGTTLVGAVAVAALAAWGGWWVGSRPAAPAGSAGGAPGAAPAAAVSPAPASPDGAAPADAGGRKVLYWHDPMVPGQRFDRPGKSPFMDMQLVPVYADAADEGAVTISPRLAQSFGVRLIEAKEGALAGGFSAPGTLVVDERTIVAVQARVQGYVEKLLVRATYDSVRAGQPLAELYVPEWLAAQEELLALKGSAQPGAAGLVDAARVRLGLLGMPAAEIARVEREGRTSARVTIAAPQAGVVWEIGARDGMAVMPGTTLFRLAGLGSVWVVAEVPEIQAGALRTGAPVEATLAAFPGRVFRGTVATLLPEVNAATRTVRARIVLANPDVALKPGMFATVQFGAPAQAAKRALLVPSEAVIRTGRRNVVIVAQAEGRYAPVEVALGRESGDSVEITRGLEPGAKVVASGQFMIDSEASLKGVLARMGAAADAPPTDPHAGHAMPPPTDPHAGHVMPPPTEPRAGTAMPAAAGATEHEAEGVVRGVGAEVLIKHGAIPAAGMGAMTMAFKAPPSGVPPAVTEGTSVRFRFVITPKGEFALTGIAPVGGPVAGSPDAGKKR